MNNAGKKPVSLGLASASTSKPRRNVAYGGLLVDGRGKVIPRNFANRFDGLMWTFPKMSSRGKWNSASSSITGSITGDWISLAVILANTRNVRRWDDASITKELNQPGGFKEEMSKVPWASNEEAKVLITKP